MSARFILPFFTLLGVSACSSDPEPGRTKPSDAGADSKAEAGTDAAVDAPGDSPSDGLPTEAGPTTSVISEPSSSQYESETHLVRAPGGRLLAVWMSLGPGLQNGYALSEDDGANWSAPSTMTVPSSKGDPVATVAQDGSFYYGFLDGTCVSGNCSNGHMWVARLAPGSTTFEAPVDASPADPAEFYDKPWFMTGSDGTLILIANGRIGTYPTNIDRLIVARSTDGKAWSHTFAVPAGSPGRIAGIPHACISTTGSRVWIVHVDSETPTFAAIRWSDDLGLTWPPTQSSSGFALTTEAAQIQSYDLRCIGEGDDVWVMYGLASGASSATSIPPLEEIHIAHSGDGGATWDPATVIQKPGELYLRPEIAREPSGALVVMAYSGAQEGDTNGSIRRWRSTDQGKTFLESTALHTPIRFTGDRSGQLWIGDYSGLISDGSQLLATFVDNSSGAAHIRFVKTASP